MGVSAVSIAALTSLRPLRQPELRKRLRHFLVIVFDIEDAFDAAFVTGMAVARRIRRTTDDAAQLGDVLNRHERGCYPCCRSQSICHEIADHKRNDHPLEHAALRLAA